MVNLKEISGVTLAYLGDAVWELYVRRYMILKGYNNNKCNKLVKEMVNAKIQSRILEIAFPTLTKEEQEIVKRVKNGNIKSFPKSCSVLEYRDATAFEGMIGIFYETGKYNRIEEIIKICEELLKR